MTFHVGQKVATDLSPLPHDIRAAEWRGTGIPIKGVVYTVSNIFVSMRDGSVGEEMIELVELPNPATPDFEAGFFARAFRPVQERKTDISIFTDILRKVERKHKRSVHA